MPCLKCLYEDLRIFTDLLDIARLQQDERKIKCYRLYVEMTKQKIKEKLNG